MFTIDTSTGFGKRIARQLDDERVVWLTTVAPSGTPAPTPVWFLWHDDEILISSEPDQFHAAYSVLIRITPEKLRGF